MELTQCGYGEITGLITFLCANSDQLLILELVPKKVYNEDCIMSTKSAQRAKPASG